MAKITKRDRATLKSYFGKGCRPTAEQFAELIESVPNIVDDDLEATPAPAPPISTLEPEPTPEPETKPTTSGELREIPANGEWHDLPMDKDDRGVQIYRIVASCNDKRRHKCYLCDVIASHDGVTPSELLSSKKHWWGWSGAIKFRWQQCASGLYLQMRSSRNMGQYAAIYYTIDELWEGKVTR